MRNFVALCLAALFFLLYDCQSDTPRYAEKLEKTLAGLNKLTLTQKEKHTLLAQISDSSGLNFPVYSPEGERLTQTLIRQQEMNMTVDAFGGSVSDIKALVFRPLTKAELAEIFRNVDEERQRHKQALANLTAKPAPVFSAMDVGGNLVDLNALKGKVVVLNFWFIKCFACVEEMPELNRIVQEFQGKDVVFVGLTFDPAAETRAFLQRKDFDYQVVAEARAIFDQYGIKPCPTNIVVDKTGQVVFAESGYKPHDNVSYNNITDAIQRALH